jgi:hypothetical protein
MATMAVVDYSFANRPKMVVVGIGNHTGVLAWLGNNVDGFGREVREVNGSLEPTLIGFTVGSIFGTPSPYRISGDAVLASEIAKACRSLGVELLLKHRGACPEIGNVRVSFLGDAPIYIHS